MRKVVLLAFIWGWSFVFIKVAVRGFTPTTLACGRMALGAAALLVVGRITHVRIPTDPTFWRRVAVNGIVGCAIPFTLLAWGEQRITSALTAVAQATTTIFAALFAVWMLRQPLRGLQVVGLLVGVVGVAVAAGVGGSDLTGSDVSGVVAAMAAGAAYGFTFCWSQRHLVGVPPVAAATGQLLVGAAALAPLAIVTSLTSGFDPTLDRVGALTMLGIIGTGLAYWINFRAIAEVGGTSAALVTYMVPPVAVVVGWLVLDEPIAPNLLTGLAMIIGSVLLVRFRTRSPRPSVTVIVSAQPGEAPVR